MGNIVSKLKCYIHTKVENTKIAIKTKVDNTKNAIYTKVNNTKQAIVNRITNTRNALCQKVTDAKTGIQNRINAAADAVFNTVNAIQNGITTKVTNTVTGVHNFKNGIVTKCVKTKEGVIRRYTNTRNTIITTYTNTVDGIIQRYTRTRDGIIQQYTDSRDYVYKTYRQAREVKLTRYEKFKYSVLFLLFLSLFTLSVLTAWDLYYENYERIHDRNKSVWLFICYLCDRLWFFTEQSLVYAYHATCVIIQYLLYATKLVVYYSWEGTKLASWYAWEVIKFSAANALEGSKLAWQYISQVSVIVGQYLWHGLTVLWEYLLIGTTVTWHYVALGSKCGLHYTIEGSKLAAQYTAEGTKYAIVHGSIAFKDGSIKFIQWLFYFLTNFRAASKEAAVYLYESSMYLGGCLMTGSYHGSILLWDGTCFTAIKAWEGSVFFCKSAVTLYCSLADFLHSAIEKFIYITDTSAFAIYSAIVSTALALYHSVVWFFQTANHCIDVSVYFVWMWSHYVVMTTSHMVYIGLSKYGLVWACKAANQLVHWSCVFGTILWKFITDLCVYVANCLYTGCVHIYNVFYILFSFIYQICSAVSTVIKTSAHGLRYCVTAVFGVIIWCLEETLLAYAFMLNKYNMYREILFTGFIVLLCLYCTGLMRDRKRSLEERNGEPSESSSESDDDDDELDDADSASTRLIPRKKDLELPSFPEKGKKQFPSYDDPELEDDLLEAEATGEPSTDDLPPTDDEDEFELEQNVPDFMDLSASEPEPEPPDPYTTDQETESHDLSFESHPSRDSGQEVPDIDSSPEENANKRLTFEEDTNGNGLSEQSNNFDLDNNNQEQLVPGHEADIEDYEEEDVDDAVSADDLAHQLHLIKQRRT